MTYPRAVAVRCVVGKVESASSIRALAKKVVAEMLQPASYTARN